MKKALNFLLILIVMIVSCLSGLGASTVINNDFNASAVYASCEDDACVDTSGCQEGDPEDCLQTCSYGGFNTNCDMNADNEGCTVSECPLAVPGSGT